MEKFFETAPFSLDKTQKEKLLFERLGFLTRLHYENCEGYKNILEALSFNAKDITEISDIPFIPVSLFKERDLKSVAEKDVVKVMTSSGTSGQAVSKIFLDKRTASFQQKTLAKIVADFIGQKRLPMLIIDSPSVIKDRNLFSARGAGILGFSIFGRDRTYALKEDMSLDIEAIKNFLEKYKGQKILLFGFTFMIWEYFVKAAAEGAEAGGCKFDFSNGILIHGGGWKKLINEAVSPAKFKEELRKNLEVKSVHDYYGMVEQTGTVYMECEEGHLHASIFSDIIIRKYKDFSAAGAGEKGIMQVLSTLPESYPGHSLLTEDEGVLLGVDNCPCGRKGKYFKVLGRLKNAEIRGCSDTFG